MALTKVTGSVIKDSVSLSGNVSVGGTLTYQDVTNVDALGIGTFRSGINVSGGQLDVGSNVKIGNAGIVTASNFKTGVTNLHSTGLTLTGGQLDVGSNIKVGTAGVVTATSFVGNGASLTNLNGSNITSGTVPVARIGTGTKNNTTFYRGDGTFATVTPPAITAINSASNNRIVTSDGGTTVTGEANLTFDGNDLSVTGTAPAINFIDTDSDDYKIHNVQGVLKITDTTASADRFVINDNGTGYFLSNFQIGSTTSSPGATLHVKANYPSLKVDSGGHGSDAYVRIISGNAQNSRVDFGDSDDDNIGIIDYDHANNSMSFTTNTNERVRIDSAGRVQIGHTSSIVGGRVEVHAATAETQITINESSDSGAGPALYINRTRGSNLGSPGPIQNGNYMGSIHFGSYDTNSYEKGASIQARADGQTWADGDCPTRLSLWTTRDAESSPREWMRIWNDGTLTFARGGGNQIHNTTHLNGKHRYSFDYSTDDSSIPYRGMRVYGSYGIGGGSTDYSYAALFDGGKTHNNCQNQYITFNQITQQLVASTHGVYCENTSSYGHSYCYEGKMMKNLGAYTNSYTYNSNIVATNTHAGNAYHFRGEDNGTNKVLILRNGDLDNANNSYSGISDIKLKENIVDAGSQWDDIKNLKVRKFNFRRETGYETHTQIGLIAQETEPVSAGLVYDEKDITVDESTGEGTVTGTTKHIKYSVLYMKAIKGLQEAMTRIETLEAEVTALKGS